MVWWFLYYQLFPRYLHINCIWTEVLILVCICVGLVVEAVEIKCSEQLVVELFVRGILNHQKHFWFSETPLINHRSLDY